MSGVVRYWRIAEGNAGVVQTVDLMVNLIKTAPPEVREQANAILHAAHVTSPEPNPRAHAIYQWVQQHMIYTPDRTGVIHMDYGVDQLDEELRSPAFMLKEIEETGKAYGDCDDYVILMGSLLTAINVPYSIMVTSSKADRVFDHVFMVLIDDTPMDAITGEPFGWSIPREGVTNSMEFWL